MRGDVQGYSDRINHAFAFAAKHHGPRAPAHAPLPFLAHPANVAVILARYGADETTLVAAIIHLVLESTPGHDLATVERKVSEKFGAVVLGVAREAAATSVDEHGEPIPWRRRKRALLNQVLVIHPRAIDIRCAAEIHECGSAIALATRLGPEYLEPQGFAPFRDVLAWHADLRSALTRRPDWTTIGMRRELESLSARLASLARTT